MVTACGETDIDVEIWVKLSVPVFEIFIGTVLT